MRHATVYARRGRLYVTAKSETVDWLWVVSPPFLTCDESAPVEEVGRLVREALGGSRQRLPQPPPHELTRLFEPVLELAGVQRYDTFEKGARAVQVYERKATVKVTPTRNAGRDGGFQELLERSVELHEPDAATLGAAVRRALAESA